MHKLRKYKTKLLKAKYRNNDGEKSVELYKKIQGHFQDKTLKIVNFRRNSKTEKNPRKFPGFPGCVDTQSIVYSMQYIYIA